MTMFVCLLLLSVNSAQYYELFLFRNTEFFECGCSSRWIKEAADAGDTVLLPPRPCENPVELRNVLWSTISIDTLGSDCTSEGRGITMIIIQHLLSALFTNKYALMRYIINTIQNKANNNFKNNQF